MASGFGQHFLGLNGQGCMRNQAETLFRNQFPGYPADTVRLVFYPRKSSLQILDELVLALGKLACLFFGALEGAVVLDGLERRGGIFNVTTSRRVLYSAFAFSSFSMMMARNSSSSSSL